MTVPEHVDKTAQQKKFYLTQWQRGTLFFLLYMPILFKFEVAILKTMYNMTSSNDNLTLKVIGRMTLPSA